MNSNVFWHSIRVTFSNNIKDIIVLRDIQLRSELTVFLSAALCLVVIWLHIQSIFLRSKLTNSFVHSLVNFISLKKNCKKHHTNLQNKITALLFTFNILNKSHTCSHTRVKVSWQCKNMRWWCQCQRGGHVGTVYKLQYFRSVKLTIATH